MSLELYNYLKERFYKNNHSKYRHYFEEWVSNITEDQLFYFKQEKVRLERYGSN